MDPERFARLKQLVGAAWELPASERHDFLSRECQGDRELLQDAEVLLAEEASAADAFRTAGAEDMILEALPIDDTTTPTIPRSSRERPRDHRVVGPYRLLQRIGEGGMGEVYEAERIPAAGQAYELPTTEVASLLRSVGKMADLDRSELAEGVSAEELLARIHGRIDSGGRAKDVWAQEIVLRNPVPGK